METTSGMEPIIRDSGKLCSRLFDHRQYVSSEIHRFVDEFETKPAKRENKHLEASLAAVTEMTQTELPNATLLMEDGASKLIGSLEVAIRMADNIVEKRGKDPFVEYRQAERKKRETAWNAFMEELCVESDKIESDYKQSKKRMNDFYDELNEPLKN